AQVGTDYVDVINLAGILPQSVLPMLTSSYVDGQVTVIAVGYYDGQMQHPSINANSDLIAARFPVEGLTEEVVNKLA
ncbi:MAG: hypothetical protein J1F68_06245, partial [Clostridiales bacterium]|nr:hypothetical protein [Clostridiales bacterium]